MSQDTEDYIQPIFPIEGDELKEESIPEMEEEETDEFLMMGGERRLLWPTIEQYSKNLFDMFKTGYPVPDGKKTLPPLAISELVPALIATKPIKLPITEKGVSTFEMLKTYPGKYELKEVQTLPELKGFFETFKSGTYSTPIFYLSKFMTRAIQQALKNLDISKGGTVMVPEKDRQLLLLYSEIVVRLYILYYINLYALQDLCVHGVESATQKKYVFPPKEETVAVDFLTFLTDLQKSFGATVTCLFGKSDAPTNAEIGSKILDLYLLYEILKDYGMVYFLTNVLDTRRLELKEIKDNYYFENMNCFLEHMIEAFGGPAVTKDCATAPGANTTSPPPPPPPPPPAKKCADLMKFINDAVADKKIKDKSKLTEGDIKTLGISRKDIEDCFKDEKMFPKPDYGFEIAAAPSKVDCNAIKKQIDDAATKKEILDKQGITEEELRKLSLDPKQVADCIKDATIFPPTEYVLATPQAEAARKIILEVRPEFPKLLETTMTEKIKEYADGPLKLTIKRADVDEQIILLNRAFGATLFEILGAKPKILAVKDYDEIGVPPDGWCFYHSLLKQVDATKPNYPYRNVVNPDNDMVRTKKFIEDIRDWIKDPKQVDKFKHWKMLYEATVFSASDKKYPTYEEYLANINNEKDRSSINWADPAFGLSEGAANVLSKNIEGYQKDGADYILKFQNTPTGATETLFIVYNGRNHYNILRKKAAAAGPPNNGKGKKANTPEVLAAKKELDLYTDELTTFVSSIAPNLDKFSPEEQVIANKLKGVLETEKKALDALVDKFADKTAEEKIDILKKATEIVEKIQLVLDEAEYKEYLTNFVGKIEAEYSKLKVLKNIKNRGKAASASSSAASKPVGWPEDEKAAAQKELDAINEDYKLLDTMNKELQASADFKETTKNGAKEIMADLADFKKTMTDAIAGSTADDKRAFEEAKEMYEPTQTAAADLFTILVGKVDSGKGWEKAETDQFEALKKEITKVIETGYAKTEEEKSKPDYKEFAVKEAELRELYLSLIDLIKADMTPEAKIAFEKSVKDFSDKKKELSAPNTTGGKRKHGKASRKYRIQKTRKAGRHINTKRKNRKA
jgi:hypothetical protein